MHCQNRAPIESYNDLVELDSVLNTFTYLLDLLIVFHDISGISGKFEAHRVSFCGIIIRGLWVGDSESILGRAINLSIYSWLLLQWAIICWQVL